MGVEGFGGGFDVGDYPEDPVGLTVAGVIAELELYIQENEEKGSHAYGETQDVDKGEDAVTPEIAEGDFQIVFEHGEVFWLLGLPGVRDSPGVMLTVLSGMGLGSGIMRFESWDLPY